MRITLFIVAAVLLGTASPASAQIAPPPKPIVTSIDRVPMVELWDGGGGLPYLGSSTSYNAGDWENTLRAYHDGPAYNGQLGKVDAVAAQWLRRANHFKQRFHFKAKQFGHSARRAMLAVKHHGKHHGHSNKKRAVVFDVDETLLS